VCVPTKRQSFAVDVLSPPPFLPPPPFFLVGRRSRGNPLFFRTTTKREQLVLVFFVFVFSFFRGGTQFTRPANKKVLFSLPAAQKFSFFWGLFEKVLASLLALPPPNPTAPTIRPRFVPPPFGYFRFGGGGWAADAWGGGAHLALAHSKNFFFFSFFFVQSLGFFFFLLYVPLVINSRQIAGVWGGALFLQ